MIELLKMRPLCVLQLSIMLLRHLLYLLPGEVAGDEVFSGPAVLNVSSCPVSYYGGTFSQIYVNYTGGIVVLCFDGYYDPSKSGDCVLATTYVNDVIRVQSDAGGSSDSDIRANLPISNAAKCVVFLFVDDSDLRLLAHGSTQTSEEIAYSLLRTTHYFDVSGCRHAGVIYKPGALAINSLMCFYLSCNATSGLTVNECSPLEICRNRECFLRLQCTVAGPSIIDFYGNVNAIPDRCGYTLLSLDATPGESLVAEFREHRRKDVSMLDSLLLIQREANNTIIMEQDGNIQDDNSTLTDSILFKSLIGIIGNFFWSHYEVFFLFDGHRTQIFLEGPPGGVPPLQGLCGNSSDFQASKVITSSPSGCESLHSDTEDSTIDCNAMTKRCNLMKEAAFEFCHNHIDPEPYIQACTDTLCRYPALDGFDCHFLVSYGTACESRVSRPDDWRSAVNCSLSNAFCQDRDCKDHEFCGFAVQGQPGCYCRAFFAEPYRTTHTYGQLACNDNTASLTLVGCLLEDNGINYTNLHLNDDTCRGHLDNDTHIVHFLFNSSNTCGTNITTDYSQVIFQNAVQQSSASETVHIDFSCVFTQPADQLTLSFGIQDKSVGQTIKSGSLEYNLTMRAYEDADHRRLLDWNSEIQLNQKVWMKLTAEVLDGKLLAIVIDSCWATKEATGDGSPRYNLLKSGCAIRDDSKVTVTANGVGGSSHFSFNMFRFSHNAGPIYLHCRVVLCPKETHQCVPNCERGFGRRRRARSMHDDSDTTHISMMWTT
ncbi:uncharacterized protein LOC129194813 isoform X2 [Dunckerocampus dactyliophorus]|uniref:uncharacterized protein LOC129194813 isoform X2 n=1 Tax=Dunckerocampus dactyliophorus TaxID=161453 RepID=UPI0024053EDA|nr:uncharacterized protein LOC129194813 isoform X2 [Dunckerocampus dactyliophorus]